MSTVHTLLLVDDEPDVLAALRRTLRKTGYRILTAPDAATALKLLESYPVDLLISDIDMPHTSGVDLVDQARRKSPGTVRWLLTGGASLTSAIEAINRGEVQRYLTKPWNGPELRAEIALALERLREHRSHAAADLLTERRREMLAELEAEHPGITKVAKRLGVYVLEVERLTTLASEIHLGTGGDVDQTWIL